MQQLMKCFIEIECVCLLLMGSYLRLSLNLWRICDFIHIYFLQFTTIKSWFMCRENGYHGSYHNINPYTCVAKRRL